MRPKSSHKDLPPKMLRRTRVLKSGKVWESFYYNGRTTEGRRVEIPLGGDLNEAKRKWAELECCKAPVETEVLGFIFDRYLREVAPTKARATRYQIKSCITTLCKVFGDVNIHTVTPQQLAQYRDKRARTAPVLANRELSVFSSVWTMARE